jgi:hypothetical protein
VSTVELGQYYSVSEGVNGDEEGGTKTTTMMTMTTTTKKMTAMTMTMANTTETASLLLPPLGWNMIKFVIGNVGDDNVDSWVFLRAGLFRCISLGGGLGG